LIVPIAEITDLDVLSKVVNPRAVKTAEMARSLFNDLNKFFRWAIDQRTYGLRLNPCATIGPPMRFVRKLMLAVVSAGVAVLIVAFVIAAFWL
jgi:hypothetical protein